MPLGPGMPCRSADIPAGRPRCFWARHRQARHATGAVRRSRMRPPGRGPLDLQGAVPSRHQHVQQLVHEQRPSAGRIITETRADHQTW